MQALACLLGPVAEEYYNEMITFGSPLYPISETTQLLFDDSYFSLVFYGKTGSGRICSSTIFLPIPMDEKCKERRLNAGYSSALVSESVVTFDDKRWQGNEDPLANDDGQPPTIDVGLECTKIVCKLIHLSEDAGLIVGY